MRFRPIHKSLSILQPASGNIDGGYACRDGFAPTDLSHHD